VNGRRPLYRAPWGENSRRRASNLTIHHTTWRATRARSLRALSSADGVYGMTLAAFILSKAMW
jgi:hypothetical protein